MLLQVDSIKELVGKGTLLEESVAPFIAFEPQAFNSSKPTNYIFNHTGSYFDHVTGSYTNKRKAQPTFYYCMRGFAENYREPTDGLYFYISHRTERPIITGEFYKYVTNPFSPWRSVFNGIASVRQDKYGIPEWLCWYDTAAAPAKTVLNFFTALRLHTCWGADWYFMRLREMGFRDECAFLLSTIFAWGSQTITFDDGPQVKYSEDPRKFIPVSMFGGAASDMPFNTTKNPYGFSPFIVDRTPNREGRPLSEKCNPQPNNYIWQNGGGKYSADSAGNTSKYSKESLIKITRDSMCKNMDPYKFLPSLNDSSVAFSRDAVSEIEEKLATNKELLL